MMRVTYARKLRFDYNWRYLIADVNTDQNDVLPAPFDVQDVPAMKNYFTFCFN